MINIFSTNTPFQLFIVRNIIKNYFVNDQNIIVSTYLDGNNEDLYYIKKYDIAKVIKLKFYIQKNINSIQFFIPHTGSFFSSYFYHIAILKKRPINVFYEGMAMFYDPVVQNKLQNFKRFLWGLFCGIIYRPHSRLYPPKLIEIANACYSPILIGIDKYKKVIEVKCDLSEKEQDNDSNVASLLILSPNLSNKEIDLIVDNIRDLYDITYIKPHFELSQNQLLQLTKVLEYNNIKYELVNKNLMAEIFFMNHKINNIISQHFSSALINIRILFKSNVPIKVINEQSIPKEIVNKLNILL